MIAQAQHLQSIMVTGGGQPQWQPPSATNTFVASPMASADPALLPPMVQAPPAVASTQPMPTIYIEGELPPVPWVRGQPYAHVEITPVRPPFFVLFISGSPSVAVRHQSTSASTLTTSMKSNTPLECTQRCRRMVPVVLVRMLREHDFW